MAFDPDSYLAKKKSSFDPDKYLESKKGVSQEQEKNSIDLSSSKGLLSSSPILSKLRGIENEYQNRDVKGGLRTLANAALLNYEPEIEGGISKIFGGDYTASRDSARKSIESFEKQNPASGIALNVLGGLATPGIGAAGGLINKASGLKKLGTVAGLGAAQGALMNPGEKEGEINPLQLDERLSNAGSGAAISAGLLGAGKVLGGAANALKNLPETSKKLAFQGLGPFKADVKKIIKADPIADKEKTIKEIGDYVQKNNLSGLTEDPELLLEKIREMKNTTGQKLDDLYSEASSKIGSDINPKEIAKNFLDKINSEVKNKTNKKQIISKAEQIAEDLSSTENSIPALKEFHTDLGRYIYGKNAFTVPTQEKDAYVKAYKMINDVIENDLNKISSKDKSLGDVMRSLNKEYSLQSKIGSIAENRLSSDIANNLFGLTEKMSIGQGLAQGIGEGNPSKVLGGLLGAEIMKTGRKGLYSTSAKAANALGKLTGKIPEGLSNTLNSPELNSAVTRGLLK